MSLNSDFVAFSNEGLLVQIIISSCSKVIRELLKPIGINVTKIGQAAEC